MGMKKVTPSSFSLNSNSSRELRGPHVPSSLSISPSSLSGNRSGRSPRHQTNILSFWIPIFFGHDFQKNFSLPSTKTDSWCIHPEVWDLKKALERPIDRFMKYFQDLPVIQQVVVEAGWCREPQHPPTAPHKEFQCHIAEPPTLLRPAVGIVISDTLT